MFSEGFRLFYNIVEKCIFRYNWNMDKSDRKLRTRNLREIELLFWLLILLVLFVVGSVISDKSRESYEIHKIFLPDVDGLIVGSPVNFMGVPVGYVTKLKMVDDDEVFVKFIVTNKSTKLPKGTIANVEFSGLGGSRSLELYPPDKTYVQTYGLHTNSADNYIVVAPPKRLRDCLVLLYQMYGKIVSITYRVSYFSKEFQSPDIKKQRIDSEKGLNNLIHYSNGWLDSMQHKIKDIKANK